MRVINALICTCNKLTFFSCKNHQLFLGEASLKETVKFGTSWGGGDGVVFRFSEMS